MLRSLALLAVYLGCCATGPLPDPPTTGIAYASDGIDAHRLDIYLPKQRAKAALIVFVHGGAFMSGDRRDYASIGLTLAEQGLAVVMPSYRHYPQVDAQGSTQAVASAIAWARRHARDYGIDSRQLFLAGHSAGAQIVAMIGTHARYLGAAGESLDAIRGVFALAGAYDVRDLSDEPDSWQQLDYQIYGQTAEQRAKISPGLSIDPKTPSIEAVCGTEDDPGSCPRTLNFVHALRVAGADGRSFRAIGADHLGLLQRLISSTDPLNREFRNFITQHR